MYKLIAIDLDGTLLNSYGEISPRNLEAIKKAKEKGIKVVIASGRVIKSVENIANELDIDKKIICGNGAIIYDREKKEIEYDKFLGKQKTLQIMKICEENSIYYNVYTTRGIMGKSLNYNLLFYNHENSKKPESKQTKINIVQDMYSYIENSENDDYLKINIADNNKIIFDNIIKKLKNIKDVDVLDVSHMAKKFIEHGGEMVPIEYYYTEVSSNNVNKWIAIEKLIQQYDIKPEEVIAIGDNVNDIEMIENAGVGVVMGNGAPYIKEKANLVVSNNDEDGVAEAIEKLLLNV